MANKSKPAAGAKPSKRVGPPAGKIAPKSPSENRPVPATVSAAKPATKPVVSEKTAMKSTGPQGHS